MMIFNSKSFLRALIILLTISTISVTACENVDKNLNKKHRHGHDHSHGHSIKDKVSRHFELDDAKTKLIVHKTESKVSHSSHALSETSHLKDANKPKTADTTQTKVSKSLKPTDPKPSTSVSSASVTDKENKKVLCDRCKRVIKPKQLCQRCKREIKTITKRKFKTCSMCKRPVGAPAPSKSCLNCAKYNISCWQSHGRVMCLSGTQRRCNEKLICNHCVKKTKEIKPTDNNKNNNRENDTSPLKLKCGKVSLCARCDRKMSRFCIHQRPYGYKTIVKPVHCYDPNCDHCLQPCFASSSCRVPITIPVRNVRRRLTCRTPTHCNLDPCCD